MMVRFTSKAGPDIVMFEDDAVQLLGMMGHSGTIPSAIRAEDAQSALSELERSLRDVAVGLESVDPDEQGHAADNVAKGEGDEDRVGIRTRAFPLVNLLKAAAVRQADIMWEYDNGSFY